MFNPKQRRPWAIKREDRPTALDGAPRFSTLYCRKSDNPAGDYRKIARGGTTPAHYSWARGARSGSLEDLLRTIRSAATIRVHAEQKSQTGLPSARRIACSYIMGSSEWQPRQRAVISAGDNFLRRLKNPNRIAITSLDTLCSSTPTRSEMPLQDEGLQLAVPLHARFRAWDTSADDGSTANGCVEGSLNTADVIALEKAKLPAVPGREDHSLSLRMALRLPSHQITRPTRTDLDKNPVHAYANFPRLG